MERSARRRLRAQVGNRHDDGTRRRSADIVTVDILYCRRGTPLVSGYSRKRNTGGCPTASVGRRTAPEPVTGNDLLRARFVGS